MAMTQAEALQKLTFHSAFAQFGPNDIKEMALALRALINNEFGVGDVSAAELSFLDGVTAGVAVASKAVVLGASKELAGMLFRETINPDVAGAGSIQSDAAALLEGFQVITGANGTLGWRLPTAVAGMRVTIKGTTAGVAKIWPATGAQINAVGADTAMSLASGVIPAIFIAKTSTQWYTIPLLPS